MKEEHTFAGLESKSVAGLDRNMATLLCYLVILPPITPVVMLLLEKKDPAIRFHSLQGLFLGLVSLVAIFGLEMFAQAAGQVARPLEVIINLVILLAGGGVFLLWLLLLIRAYQGKSVKIPIIGDEAARRALSP